MVLRGSNYSYKRDDGVYVVSIGSLKNLEFFQKMCKLYFFIFTHFYFFISLAIFHTSKNSLYQMFISSIYLVSI